MQFDRTHAVIALPHLESRHILFKVLDGFRSPVEAGCAQIYQCICENMADTGPGLATNKQKSDCRLAATTSLDECQ